MLLARRRERNVCIELSEPQREFRTSPARFRAFVGGVGSGKSWAGCYDLIRRALEVKGTYLICAPVYRTLTRATWPTFREVLTVLGLYDPSAFHKSDWSYALPNGSVIYFATTHEPDHLRGPNLTGVFADEASFSDPETYTILLGRLREAGRVGWLSACFTPRGKSNWTYRVFAVTDSPDVSLTRSRTRDNPFLHHDFDATIRRQYGDGSRVSLQELDAEFLDEGASLFSRHWFKVVDAIPPLKRRIRAWDLAASEPKPGTDPDYSAGVLVGESTDGGYYVVSVIRERYSPLKTEQLIRNVAGADGPGVEVCIEQEPGSGSKIMIASLVKAMAGFNVRAIPAEGSKAERAGPFSAQAEAGNVCLIRSPWNMAYLDELESFPGGPHDDMVDACCLSFNRLAGKPTYKGVWDDTPAPDAHAGRWQPVGRSGFQSLNRR